VNELLVEHMRSTLHIPLPRWPGRVRYAPRVHVQQDRFVLRLVQ
jgi:hypothetical protein